MKRETGAGRRALCTAFLLTISVVACTPSRPVPVVTPPVAVPERQPEMVTPPPPPARPVSGMIDGGAGALWFRVAGRGPDTVIVPLAAWLGSSLASLGEGHTVIFYDPRHRGQSHALGDSTTATFDGDIADLESVRRAVGASRVSVIGYDYYAAVAAAWAARNPLHVDRLVLLSPIEPADSLARSWNPPERMARLDTTAARALVKARAIGRDTSDAIGYCAEFWRVNAPIFVGDTVALRTLRANWCQWPNESPARIATAARQAIESLGADADFAALAQGVGAPTLVMHGRLDLVANPAGAREWARRIGGARLLWLANVGHLPHAEATDVVVTAISEFLRGQWPPRAEPP